MKEAMLLWMSRQVEWMSVSEQGKEIRAYGDNKTIWYYAIVRCFSQSDYSIDAPDLGCLSSLRHLPI